MTRSAASTTRFAAVAATLMAVAATTLVAGPAAAKKYNSHTVTSKASFHTLKKHARSLDHAGVAKVTKIKRHGRVVGFKKHLKSGDKVIVKRGRHGRVKTTTLKRKSLLQRWKHRLSSFKLRRARHKNRRHAYNGFRRH